MAEFIGIGVVVIIALLIYNGTYLLSEGDVMIIERLGKYRATIYAGGHFYFPLINRAKKILTKQYISDGCCKYTIKNRIDMRETMYDVANQKVITKDNVTCNINPVLYYQITDAKLMVYSISNFFDSFEQVCKTAMRNCIGNHTFQEVLTSKELISNQLTASLCVTLEKWGCKVTKVELQDIVAPEALQRAMDSQLRTEKEKKVMITEAEGKRQSEIIIAQGKKESLILQAESAAQAKILEAEAECEAISIRGKAIQALGGNPVDYLLAVGYFEALKIMTEGKDCKTIYMPFEASNLMASAGCLRSLQNVVATHTP